MNSHKSKEALETIKSVMDSLDIALKEGNDDEKFNAVMALMPRLRDYFKVVDKEINTNPFRVMLEEMASISQGNKPTFIKQQTSNKGRPVNLPSNYHLAHLVAGIDLMIYGGLKANEAIKEASSITSLNITRIKQIRKEFHENKRDARALKEKDKMFQLGKNHALDNINAGKGILEKLSEFGI